LKRGPGRKKKVKKGEGGPKKGNFRRSPITTPCARQAILALESVRGAWVRGRKCMHVYKNAGYKEKFEGRQTEFEGRAVPEAGKCRGKETEQVEIE